MKSLFYSMNIEKVLVRQPVTLCVLVLVFFLGLSGQSMNDSDDARPGRLLSEGHNTTPAGELRVLTYKLEEIVPTRSVRSENREINMTGFRLTITLSEKLIKSSYIWIDDNAYPAFGLGTNRIGTVIHASGLPNGAKLSVSTLGTSNGEYAPTDLSILPERLFVPPPYGYETTEANDYILRRSSRFNRSLNRSVSGVELQIRSVNGYVQGSDRWFVEIGDKDYVASVGSNLLSVWLTDDEFRLLNDGDKIRVKYGRGRLAAGTTVGRLSKGIVR